MLVPQFWHTGWSHSQHHVLIEIDRVLSIRVDKDKEQRSRQSAAARRESREQSKMTYRTVLLAAGSGCRSRGGVVHAVSGMDVSIREESVSRR